MITTQQRLFRVVKVITTADQMTQVLADYPRLRQVEWGF
jgi:hypothetical protein